MDTSRRHDQRQAAQRRRDELLAAADRVVLREGPEASMNTIAAEAGITKPILYRHFGDKGGLYRAIAQRHSDAVLATCRAALDSARERRDRVEATLEAYLQAIETHPQMYRFLMHPAEEPNQGGAGSGEAPLGSGRLVAPLLRRLGEELALVINERLELGPDRELVARVWGHGIVGMLHTAGDWWLAERPCPRQELVRHLTDLLWGRLVEVGDKPRPATP